MIGKIEFVGVEDSVDIQSYLKVNFETLNSERTKSWEVY